MVAGVPEDRTQQGNGAEGNVPKVNISESCMTVGEITVETGEGKTIFEQWRPPRGLREAQYRLYRAQRHLMNEEDLAVDHPACELIRKLIWLIEAELKGQQ